MGKLFGTALLAIIILVGAATLDCTFVNHDWAALGHLNFGIIIGVAGLFILLLITGQYDDDIYTGGGGGDGGL